MIEEFEQFKTSPNLVLLQVILIGVYHDYVQVKGLNLITSYSNHTTSTVHLIIDNYMMLDNPEKRLNILRKLGPVSYNILKYRGNQKSLSTSDTDYIIQVSNLEQNY